jgi:hypothetical protein
MITKCNCQHCGQHIEFEAEGAGQFYPCPNCGKQTRLLMPSLASKAPARRKSGAAKWWMIAIAAVILVIIVIALVNNSARASILNAIGEVGGVVLIVGAISLFVFVVYQLVITGILIQVFIALLILVGFFLFCDGFFLKQNVEASKDGTIFQQIYATIELVGGALVFCGAAILHQVRKIANKPTN